MKKFMLIILIGILLLTTPTAYASSYNLNLESENLIIIYDAGWEDFDPRIIRVCSLGSTYLYKGFTILELFLKACPPEQVEKGVNLIIACYNYQNDRWIFFYILLKHKDIVNISSPFCGVLASGKSLLAISTVDSGLQMLVEGRLGNVKGELVEVNSYS